MEKTAAFTDLLSESRVREHPITHTTIFNPKASYRVEDEKAFIQLYKEAIEEGASLGVTEMPREFSPFRIDVDIKTDTLDYIYGDHLYSKEMISDLIVKVDSIIEELVDTNSDDIHHSILLEKKRYRVEEGKFKDGFHLHYPYLILPPWGFELIREKLIEALKETESWKPFDPTRLIDSGIGTKAWLLYGSKKNGLSEPYLFSQCFIEGAEMLPYKDVFGEIDIYFLLSIRNLKETASSGGSTLDRVHFKETFEDTRKSSVRKKERLRGCKREEVEIYQDLALITGGGIMEMISPERAEEYGKWIDVGWTLYCIGDGLDEFLELWINFSKLSPKFEDGVCETHWDRMENKGKTVGSLLSMAKFDSPDKYEAWKRTNSNFILGETLAFDPKSELPGEVKLAEAFTKIIKNEFVCSDAKSGTWYQFKDHKWVKGSGDVSIQKKIYEHIIKLYDSLKTSIAGEKLVEDEDERSKQRARIDLNLQRIIKIQKALSHALYLKKVTESCKLWLHDKYFLEKLNSDCFLIGVDNGVIDVRTGTFREGRPEDYISFSTKYNFKDYTEGDDDVEILEENLAKIFPNRAIKEYFLDMLCTALVGKNIHRKFFIGTGPPAAGKSFIVDLFKKSLGQYATSGNREVLISPKKTTGSANPDVARLKGVRFIEFAELTDKEELNIGVLKMASGSDALWARTLYDGEGSEFKVGIMFMHCNHVPYIYADAATLDRVRVISFESKFSDDAPKTREEQFKQKKFPRLNLIKADELKELLAPVLLWKLIKRYPSYIEAANSAGYTEPKEVKIATEKYQRDNDVYRNFFDNNIVAENGALLKVKEVIVRFNTWYLETYNVTVTTAKIRQATIRDMLSEVRFFGGIPEKNCWKGFRLKREDDKEE